MSSFSRWKFAIEIVTFIEEKKFKRFSLNGLKNLFCWMKWAVSFVSKGFTRIDHQTFFSLYKLYTTYYISHITHSVSTFWHCPHTYTRTHIGLATCYSSRLIKCVRLSVCKSICTRPSNAWICHEYFSQGLPPPPNICILKVQIAYSLIYSDALVYRICFIYTKQCFEIFQRFCEWVRYSPLQIPMYPIQNRFRKVKFTSQSKEHERSR